MSSYRTNNTFSGGAYLVVLSFVLLLLLLGGSMGALNLGRKEESLSLLLSSAGGLLTNFQSFDGMTEDELETLFSSASSPWNECSTSSLATSGSETS